MVDRLNRALLAGSPSYVQSIAVRGSTSAVFGGAVTVNSGSSGVAVTGVDVRSETLIYLSAPHLVTNAASGMGRGFAVTSLSTAPGSGSFFISCVDSLGAGSTARVGWLAWRIQ